MTSGLTNYISSYDMKFIFRNKNFILIVTAYTISQGLQEGFLPVLNINLTPLGIPEVMNDS